MSQNSDNRLNANEQAILLTLLEKFLGPETSSFNRLSAETQQDRSTSVAYMGITKYRDEVKNLSKFLERGLVCVNKYAEGLDAETNFLRGNFATRFEEIYKSE